MLTQEKWHIFFILFGSIKSHWLQQCHIKRCEIFLGQKLKCQSRMWSLAFTRSCSWSRPRARTFWIPSSHVWLVQAEVQCFNMSAVLPEHSQIYWILSINLGGKKSFKPCKCFQWGLWCFLSGCQTLRVNEVPSAPSRSTVSHARLLSSYHEGGAGGGACRFNWPHGMCILWVKTKIMIIAFIAIHIHHSLGTLHTTFHFRYHSDRREATSIRQRRLCTTQSFGPRHFTWEL